MRKLSLAILMASTLLAVPALAKDGYWYTGLKGGVSLFQDSQYGVENPGSVVAPPLGLGQPVGSNFIGESDYRTNTNAGYAVGGIIGYDFGFFRPEFELGYSEASIRRLKDDVGAVGTFPGSDGDIDILSFMFNGVFDVYETDRWATFLGAGVGLAHVKARNFSVAGSPAFMDDGDTGLAWQLLGGIRRAVTDAVDVTVEYRYFNAERLELVSAAGQETNTNQRTHNLMVGLVYNFGGEEAAPPPPPPPAPIPEPVAAPIPEPIAPPAPPAPIVAPAPGPFIVFFDWNQSIITPEAADILRRAAVAYRETGQVSIQLQGHADKSGTADYNDALSSKRAVAARAFLMNEGVPDTAIGAESFGESKPLVETEDGVREPQNRRVEITFPVK